MNLLRKFAKKALKRGFPVFAPLVLYVIRKLTIVVTSILLLRPFGGRIWIAYNPKVKQDGIGAQVQRILAIYGLAKYLGFNFLNTGIESVAVHPLDPYQSPRELNEFVAQLNKTFELPSDEIPIEYTQFSVESLTLSYLIQVKIKNLLKRKNIVIQCIEPYGIVDFIPSIYSRARTDLLNWQEFVDSSGANSDSDGVVAVHYRQGVGGLIVQKGEKYPREIPSGYFVEVIQSQLHRIKINKISIYTDAPSKDLIFDIPENQEQLWETNPMVEKRKMRVIASDLSLFENTFPGVVQIHSGGNPLEAIAFMSTASLLIIGRSSLSYVGGLLNRTGTVIFPPHFWHAPLKSWIKG